MECGEIDLAKMLQKRQGKPLDENFIRYFWQQVRWPQQVSHSVVAAAHPNRPARCAQRCMRPRCCLRCKPCTRSGLCTRI